MDFMKTLFAALSFTFAFGLAINGHSQSSFADGLIAYYPFNGNANDTSGNGKNGTVYGATLTVDRFGNPNAAYAFGGTATYIRTPLTNSIFSGDFTASAWFKVSNLTQGWPCLLDEENAGFRLQLAGDNCGCSEPEHLVSYSSSVIGPGGKNWMLVPSVPTPLDQFQQVVVTKAGTTVTMYVNGEIANTDQVANSTTQPGQYLFIGVQYDLTSYTFFPGVIDDIRIYNRALSAAEVGQLYEFESRPVVDLIKAVKPSFSNLYLGTNYQLQVSADLNTWTNQGSPFIATNASMVYPQYWDVDNWGKLFFRLQATP
jgi:hypothetical protein